jgi:hypothetical protein
MGLSSCSTIGPSSIITPKKYECMWNKYASYFPDLDDNHGDACTILSPLRWRGYFVSWVAGK